MVYINAHLSTLLQEPKTYIFEDNTATEFYNCGLVISEPSNDQPKPTNYKGNPIIFVPSEQLSKYTLIQCLSLQPTHIVSYARLEGFTCKRPERNKNDGLVSNKSAKRIKKYIGMLYVCAKNKKVFSKATGKYYTFKVNFITLTLPSTQIHDDSEIHNNIFLPFIRAVRNQHEGFMYLYKVEVQDNGNIHYHINTNTFLNWEYIRKKWNHYCEKLGYVTRSNIGNPNSTDVKAVKKYTELAKYLSAYVSKKDLYKKPFKRYLNRYKKELKEKKDFCLLPKNYYKMLKRKPNIKLWDCSEILKKNIPSLECPNDEIYKELNKMVEVCEVVQLDYARLIMTPYYNQNYPYLFSEWNKQIQHIRDYDKLNKTSIFYNE